VGLAAASNGNSAKTNKEKNIAAISAVGFFTV
jgi:hypothetical protein